MIGHLPDNLKGRDYHGPPVTLSGRPPSRQGVRLRSTSMGTKYALNWDCQKGDNEMGSALKAFVAKATDIVDRMTQERDVLAALRKPFAALVAQDDWLPDAFAQPHPKYYQQYLLHCDPRQRFSVVSFVWGPGQTTPIHDHTVWGMIGVLRGAELSTRFAPPVPGQPLEETGTDRLEAGMIDVVSPDLGDYHQVSNAFADRVSISIHVYGANIGKVERHVFDRQTGAAKTFISGFSSEVMPNIWA